MAQVQSVINYQLSGISTQPNQFSEVPQAPIIGGIEEQEFVFTRDGILETRRGWRQYIDLGTVGYPTVYGNVLTQVEFENYLVFWTDKNIIGYTLDGTTFTAYSGNFYAPTPTDTASRIRFIQSNNNLYWTSSVGVWKLDFISNAPQLAGAPQALDCFATITQVNGGFLSSDASVSYRIQWSYYDANNNLILGPPSNQIQVSNSNVGSQTINLGGSATGGGSTGLSGATIYTASVLVNGSDNIALNITGSTATTFTTLLTEINTALGGVAVASLSGGNLLITSTLTPGSAVSWADGATHPLAASLTGFVAINTEVDGTAEVNLTFMIPYPIAINDTNNWSYNIYRGNQSAAAVDEGDDNGQLVYTGQPTSGQLTARIVTYTDNLPDDLRGAVIDTAPSQQGIGAADFQPPLCQDLVQYRGYTFYIDTASLYTLDFTLVAVGSPDGIQIGDTITVTYGTHTVTITGASSENTAAGQFQVYTSGDPASNITLTAQSIDRVLNLYPANTYFWAQYISTATDLPGQLSLVDLVLPGVPYYITTSRGSAFSPVLPSSGSTSVNTAIRDVIPNQMILSKYLTPESVPIGVPGGIIQVGSTNFAILRGNANRTSLFIFKGGQEGVFYIQGSEGPTPGAVASNFSLNPFDNTVHMTNPNVCDLLNNSIYVLTDQGGVSVSDSYGVQLVIRPVQRDFLALQAYSNFNAVTNSVSYSSECEWIINVPEFATDTTATQSYVYNYITQNWTKWTRPFTSMYLRPSQDKLYAAAPVKSGVTVNSQVKVESKMFDNTDYHDEVYTVTITSAAPITSVGFQTLILTSVVNLAPDQIITQGGNTAIISSVSTSLNKITIQGQALTTGSATVTQPIYNYFMSHPITNFAQAVIKKWSEGNILVLNTTVDDLTLSFITDWTVYESSQPVDFGPQVAISDQFGVGPFGVGPFALVQTNFSGRLRTLVPRAFAYSNWIQFIVQATCINGPLRLEGIGVVCENISSNQY